MSESEESEKKFKLPVSWTSTDLTKKLSREDSQLLARAVQLEETDPPSALRLALQLITAIVIVFIVWASFTTFAEKAVTPGEILPIGRAQPIQHQEGGTIAEINVSEGERVTAGTVLMRMNTSALGNELGAAEARTASLALELERLRAFVEERDPNFDDFAASFPEMIRDQQAVFDSAVSNRTARRQALDEQVTARETEIAGIRSETSILGEQVRVLQETVDIRQQSATARTGSRINLLEAQQQLATAKASVASRQTALGRAQAALADARSTRLELDEVLTNESLEEISRLNTEYITANERRELLRDRMSRATIVAGVDGFVTGLISERPGAVVGSGDVLVSIVPADAPLVAEVKLSPRDVGHVQQGMSVFIRVDSYKFGRYGGINGTVLKVSADTFDDDPDFGPYFRTQIELERDYVGPDPDANRVVPGMTLSADIKTGDKSLLAYLIRPVSNSLNNAFSER